MMGEALLTELYLLTDGPVYCQRLDSVSLSFFYVLQIAAEAPDAEIQTRHQSFDKLHSQEFG